MFGNDNGTDMSKSDISFLADLEEIIQQRLSNGSDESYTARLVASGDKRVAQKVGEEAVELVLAAAAGDRDEQMNEAADLIYHLLVLLSSKGIQLSNVVEVLQGRHRQR
jgi:phosphoribosyl-ATP pyrophosphohydrolase/phosphoribosyl-AMP cyclohydrolase